MNGIYQDAIRGWTERVRKAEDQQANSGKGAGNRRPSRWPKSPWVGVVDCETTVDEIQALNFLVFRLCRWRSGARLTTVRELLVYGDDLPERDADGLAVLRRYARRHRLPSPMSARKFVDTIFYPLAYETRALIVCFNSPFDLSRLAVDWGEARKTMRGGFSFKLTEFVDAEGAAKEHQYRPRLRIRHLDSKKSQMRFARPTEPSTDDFIPDDAVDGQPDQTYSFPGYFLDLKTPVWALTNRAHSLDTAAEAFGTKHRKSQVNAHGRITPAYIDYARNDVLVTAELLEKVREEYDKHPINLPITQAVSPASIAKAYLDAWGIQPILKRQPDFPREILGISMAALAGGRAEVRIRWL
jgi:hypothetical protein